MPRAHVTRQLFKPFKAILLGHDLSEERQRLFILVVQVVAPEFLHLLLYIRDAQIPLVRREPGEVSLRLVVGQPIILPEQQREQIVEKHRGVHASLVAWYRQIFGEAVAKAIAET